MRDPSAEESRDAGWGVYERPTRTYKWVDDPGALFDGVGIGGQCGEPPAELRESISRRGPRQAGIGAIGGVFSVSSVPSWRIPHILGGYAFTGRG
jgi:hypothetical protein